MAIPKNFAAGGEGGKYDKNRRVQTRDFEEITITPDGRVFHSNGSELDVDKSINSLRLDI